MRSAIALMLVSFWISRTVAEAAAEKEANDANWPQYGREADEARSSPLKSISADNVQRLGLQWSLELPDVTNAGTMPLAVDGVIYFTVDQSKVHAVDARSGRLLWRYDPKAAETAGRKLRYTFGPRGLAYWNGKIYVGTSDGRLIAIDARNGKPLWDVLTVQPDDVRGISGAPRVFNGKVIVGNAGADYGPVRGYVSTYDAETGRMLWRFWTVPGNPADGFENAAMAMAAQTWTGEWWRFGGGGTVWNAITYDPEFNRVYIGVGNGQPWNRKIRSPGGGDNLFLSSIVALDADSGEYRWHYQTTPGETWDYSSAMDMVLANLRVAGQDRKVLLHAPKNGFFYVIDRVTGKLISAEKLGVVTWAERIDLGTGRPVEAANARFETGETLIWPGSPGLHSWQPMAYNQQAGLVYIPTMGVPGIYRDKSIAKDAFRYDVGAANTGVEVPTDDAPPDIVSSSLVAWDPVAQREAWRVSTPGMWNGGTMTTAGNLVFQGHADGSFNAYAADSGAKLWSFYAGMGISGAPITFSAEGRQYVTVLAGWGGGAGLLGSIGAQHGWISRVHINRLLTFALDGTAKLAGLVPPRPVTPVDDATFVIDAESANRGKRLYSTRCAMCHGIAAVSGGTTPDLRASAIPLSDKAFAAVVGNGALEARGMPRFDELTNAQLEDLRQYVRSRARESLARAPH